MVSGLLRTGRPDHLAAVLRSRDRDQIARAFKDCDPARVVDAARRGDLEGVASALLAVDDRKGEASRKAHEARVVAAALRSRLTDTTCSRATLRLKDALRSRDVRRIAAALRGRDVDSVVAALATGDRARIVRAFQSHSRGRTGVAVDEAEAVRVVDALPSDNAEIDQIGAALVAADLERRILRKISGGLRGRDVNEIVASLQAGDHDLVVARLSQRKESQPQERSEPLTFTAARRIAMALPADNRELEELAQKVLAHGGASDQSPDRLSDSEVDDVLSALDAVDVDALAALVNNQQMNRWNEDFGKILPQITAAAQRALFGVSGRPASYTEGLSLAISAVGVFWEDAAAGRHGQYRLDGPNDLAAILVKIAYDKAVDRLKRSGVLVPQESDDGGVALANIPCKMDDWLRDTIKKEGASHLRLEIESLKSSLDREDAVILRCQLEGMTLAQTAEQVERECGTWCSEDKVRFRLKVKIREPLRRRLRRWNG